MLSSLEPGVEDSLQCRRKKDGKMCVISKWLSTHDKANVSHCGEMCYKPRLNNVLVLLVKYCVSLFLVGMVDTSSQSKALRLIVPMITRTLFVSKRVLREKFILNIKKLEPHERAERIDMKHRIISSAKSGRQRTLLDVFTPGK